MKGKFKIRFTKWKLPLYSCYQGIFLMLFSQRLRLYVFCLCPLSELYNPPSWWTNRFLLLFSTAMKTARAEDCYNVWSLWKRSRLFVLITTSKKTIALLHQEQKKYMKYCENYVFMLKIYRILTFFSCCLPESLTIRPQTRTKDHRARSPFFRITSKILLSYWNLQLQHYREEHKSYLQGVVHWARYDFILVRFSW